jgi:hypothetical protein
MAAGISSCTFEENRQVIFPLRSPMNSYAPNRLGMGEEPKTDEAKAGSGTQ